MVMIIMPVKGRQKNLLWCMGSYGNTSMPKSLTSNRQNLEKKKKKKKRKKKTRKWSFGSVIKYRWIIIIRMRPISNHLIKMEHNHAYSNAFSTWVKFVFPCRASFWLSISESILFSLIYWKIPILTRISVMSSVLQLATSQFN